MNERSLLPYSPPSARIEQVRECYARQGMAVDIDPLGDARVFRVDLKSIPLSANIGLGSGNATPHMARRSPVMAAREGVDAVLLARSSRPFAYTSGSLTQVAFTPGDTLVAPMDAAFECVHPSAGAMQTLWIQRAALPALLNGPAQRMANSPHLDLLFSYAASIQRQALVDALEPALASQAARHLTDLLALAFGARGGMADLAHQRGERSVRLADMRAYMGHRYSDPQLSVAHLSQRHHMSVRQVQRLFEDAGTTFTTCLQNHRLDHVRRALTDPAQAGMLIATLAYKAGFSDLAAFNRLFKRRYGATPGQVRESAPFS
ncbi:helix-turn-helix domain-containing protein [Ottowia thiooxydans]|uniref:helix-turn-helix domain-containing protein n=1 Tax=Ottowia thiooxydans TaxID=219182 RepID=UPI000427C88F|nr:AraC family transcriptional regulator [Ottowia thiooxydans]